jgi:hypothetical protein
MLCHRYELQGNRRQLAYLMDDVVDKTIIDLRDIPGSVTLGLGRGRDSLIGFQNFRFERRQGSHAPLHSIPATISLVRPGARCGGSESLFS